MKKCIIHIGMNKTGSTAIQDFLSQTHIDGFRYLELGDPNHSRPLQMIYDPEFNVPARFLHPSIRRQTREELKARFFEQLAIGQATLIISGEGLSRPALPEKSIHDLVEDIGCFGYEISVHGIVRDPLSFIKSNLQQTIKAGAKFDLSTRWPNYRKRFEKWENANVAEFKLHDFNEIRSTTGSSVAYFAKDILGIPWEGFNDSKSNRGLDFESLSLVYYLRHIERKLPLARFTRKASNVLLAKSSFSTRTDWFLSPVEVANLVSKNQSDLEWMNEKMGGSFDLTPKKSGLELVNEQQLLEYGRRLFWPAVKSVVNASFTHKTRR